MTQDHTSNASEDLLSHTVYKTGKYSGESQKPTRAELINSAFSLILRMNDAQVKHVLNLIRR